MAQPLLQICDLHVSVAGTPIVQGLSVAIQGGEVHAVMGPNGAGKSAFAQALMGHPRYVVTSGKALLDGKNLLKMTVDERARAGLFLATQDPAEMAGVSNANFMRLAVNAKRGDGNGLPVLQFHRHLMTKIKELGIDPTFAERYLNEGFSGGEKVRNEILQMALLKPRIAILDEIDAGQDIDTLKIVAKAVQEMRTPEQGIVAITQGTRLLESIAPTHVHVLRGGRIVRTGGKQLALQVEQNGYDWIDDPPREGSST
ncbi:Fe-S cluster assembly ATPase SufC [Tumebacillus permanentifrigoris]|uniref:Iron-regulated ABC transporter ATPase subunit SufC n=1 Tax=Tumebacillus permanentifrigoris TaxID=378543 RepID=A0A316D2C8_9BACL|nr:Fe-S cluster assembly ATPase SufC [Tumebacillus permanentifrigoris]PWK05030.1 iron-regulated ABC transporter ATPase subunit SufC [Tumebacillus permanentifrigoris]